MRIICSKCGESVPDIIRHLKKHHKFMENVCEICGMESSNKDSLLDHIKKQHRHWFGLLEGDASIWRGKNLEKSLVMAEIERLGLDRLSGKWYHNNYYSILWDEKLNRPVLGVHVILPQFVRKLAKPDTRKGLKMKEDPDIKSHKFHPAVKGQIAIAPAGFQKSHICTKGHFDLDYKHRDEDLNAYEASMLSRNFVYLRSKLNEGSLASLEYNVTEVVSSGNKVVCVTALKYDNDDMVSSDSLATPSDIGKAVIINETDLQLFTFKNVDEGASSFFFPAMTSRDKFLEKFEIGFPSDLMMTWEGKGAFACGENECDFTNDEKIMITCHGYYAHDKPKSCPRCCESKSSCKSSRSTFDTYCRHALGKKLSCTYCKVSLFVTSYKTRHEATCKYNPEVASKSATVTGPSATVSTTPVRIPKGDEEFAMCGRFLQLKDSIPNFSAKFEEWETTLLNEKAHSLSVPSSSLQADPPATTSGSNRSQDYSSGTKNDDGPVKKKKRTLLDYF